MEAHILEMIMLKNSVLDVAQYFLSEKARDNHYERCKTKDQIIVNMPKEGEHISFKNFDKMDKVPFAIYADFESFTIPIAAPETPLSSDSSYTQKYQKHIPSGFCDILYSKMTLNHQEELNIQRRQLMMTLEKNFQK